MADDDTDAAKNETARESQDNADAIREVDRAEARPRGNVHSHAEDEPEVNAPPPLPN